MIIFHDITFINILDLLGTFAFALSGIQLASGKNTDLFGAYVIGFVTAVGGGTVRDLLLDVQPFWLTDPSYLITTGAALVSALLFKDKIFQLGITLFMLDTAGLGLFTVVGINKSIAAGLPFWACIIMGTITGSLGGVFRDIILNEVPFIFRKEIIYALACISGGIAYFIISYFKFSAFIVELASAFTTVLVRIIAVKFNIRLPILNFVENEKDDL